MGKTNYPGIDYGLGKTNINTKTGIRFGIISVHSLHNCVYEDFEADYGNPNCPECGDDVEESDQRDWYCPKCRKHWYSDHCYPEDPVSSTYDDGDLKMSLDNDNDVWVFQSPYYTLAQFCSPCAPGAGNLENFCPEGGAKTYCLGPDWFNDDKPPYTVYSVKDDSIIFAYEEEE